MKFMRGGLHLHALKPDSALGLPYEFLRNQKSKNQIKNQNNQKY
jgi:hypothetical protein